MIADYPLIPVEAFLYMPSNDRIVQYQNETRTRIIFGGGVPFDEQQQHHISQLKAYIKNQTRKQYLSRYSDDFLLRFLQATSFDYDECLESLENYHNWQKKMLPLTLTDNILKYLKQGPLYMSGRDYHFRPIVVVNIKKILELKIKEEELMNMLGFFFQYLIENCLIEGQVQTWNTIIDLGNCSVFSLGGTLVDIFKARANHNYLLNFPSSIKLICGMIKSVLKQSQLRKITMCDGKYLKEQDFVKINPHQVQIKYGGRHPDMKNFWPIQIDPYVFTAPSSKLDRPITQAGYDRLYTEGKLKDRKIKKSLIKKFCSPITELKMQEQDVLTERNGSKIQKLSRNIQKSEIKSEEMVFPEQKRPFNPGPLQKVFSFDQLF